MNADLLFRIANNLALFGWLILIVLPRWQWASCIKIGDESARPNFSSVSNELSSRPEYRWPTQGNEKNYGRIFFGLQ